MARKKKQPILLVEVGNYAAEGKCVSKMEDGKTLFVEKAVPGDKAEVRITKNKKSYAEGVALRIVEPSANRVSPFCEHFGVCGGCKWQMLPYDLQLQYKQQQVADQLTRIAGIELPEILPIVGSAGTTYYRNKLEFTFCTHRYLTPQEIETHKGESIPSEKALGFHAPGFFDKVVPINQCYLQPEPSNKILQTLRAYTVQQNLAYYDFKKQDGWLRNVVIRVASTGAVLVNIIVKHDCDALHQLWRHLLLEVPEITSLHYTINPKLNDTIYDLPVVCVHGEPYIFERLEEFKFKISPKSFFQTNTRQAEKLYQTVREFAKLKGGEVLYDLYCGTGSIGIFCAPKAGKVIGVEAVADAIANAEENARLNGINNAQFFCGDAMRLVDEDFVATHGKPDVVITDPPRAGMHEALVKQLLLLKAKRIVYVSCNPATQARDLALLAEAYEVKKLQPVDMFPHTHHIENVALLELKALL